MKFQSEHYQSLKSCIVAALNTEGKSIAELKQIADEKKFSETRFLWDIFWTSRWSTLCRDHYNEGDYFDAHITTALRNIVKDLSV